MRLLIIVILFLSLSSCSQSGKNETELVSPENAISRDIQLSDLADDISYIPLSNEEPIGQIARIKTSGDLFFIAAYGEDILVFDKEGKFQHKIGRTGNGPDEYMTGIYFTIDNENRLVYVLDNQRILKYTFRGEFQSEISIAKYGVFYDIAFHDGLIYLFDFISFGYAKYDWIVLDNEGELVSTKLNNIPDFPSQEGGSGFIFSDNQSLFYMNLFNDTIFSISGTDYQAAYILPENARQITNPNTDEKNFTILDAVKTPDQLIIRYMLDNVFCISVKDKNEQNLQLAGSLEQMSYVDEGPGFVNDLDGGCPFVPKDYFSSFGLYGYRNAYELIEYVNSTKFKNATPQYPGKKAELEKLANSLDENDNPVLMLVKLKE